MFRDNPLANAWLLNPFSLREGEYIDMLKIRTLGHVLGECVAGKAAIINRHNQIVRTLTKHFSKSYTVYEGQPRRMEDGTFSKPDLIIKNSDRAIIVH